MKAIDFLKKSMRKYIRNFAIVRLYTVMTLKPSLILVASALVLVSCGQGKVNRSTQCLTSLETSAKATTVQTVSGPVARLGRTSFQGSGSTGSAKRSAFA